MFLVFIAQSILYSEHLQYGFRDGDWWLLGDYKRFGNFSLNHLIKAWEAHGIYTYQIYYIGFAAELVGVDFLKLNQLMHFTKFLATMTIFPMTLIITKNRLTAFLTTVIFAVAYPVAGAMFMFVTGGYFLAIISLCAFLISYKYTFSNSPPRIGLMVLTLMLLILTLFLNTERMYALVFLIPLIELFWLWRQKFTRRAFRDLALRLSILLMPLAIFYGGYNLWIKTQVDQGRFASSFLPQVIIRIQSITAGNWQLLLYPFTSFGSMFLHGEWWKYLGILELSSLTNFLFNLITRQMVIFGVISTVTVSLVAKKPLKLILVSLVPTFIFGLLIYVIQSHWLALEGNKRIHFDINEVGVPALFGFYVLVLSFSLFLNWLKDKENLLLPIFLGPFAAFLFIVLTWIGSDPILLFRGPQRYLTIPSIGSSLFLGGLMTLIFFRIKQRKFIRSFAWVSLFLITPIVLVNAQVTKEFFNYELTSVGMNGAEQTRMQSKFREFVPNMSNSEASLFYFDETKDLQNGYFDESTIMAGFEYWTKFNEKGDVAINRPDPVMIRSNIHCPKHTAESCLRILKDSYYIKDGIQGFLYRDAFNNWEEPRFFKLENFYALRFIDKNLVDIRKEVLEELEK